MPPKKMTVANRNAVKIGVALRNLDNDALAGFIFIANSRAVMESISKRIFGHAESRSDSVTKITAGLPVWLFDCHSRRMYGPFEAETEGATLFDVKLFSTGNDTQYTSQVKVKKVFNTVYSLPEPMFRQVIPHAYHHGHFLYEELVAEEARALAALFTEQEELAVGRALTAMFN